MQPGGYKQGGFSSSTNKDKNADTLLPFVDVNFRKASEI